MLISRLEDAIAHRSVDCPQPGYFFSKIQSVDGIATLYVRILDNWLNAADPAVSTKGNITPPLTGLGAALVAL